MTQKKPLEPITQTKNTQQGRGSDYDGGKNMGCTFCNITNVEAVGTGKYLKSNPFFCATPWARDEFRNELAQDIAQSHQDFVQKVGACSRRIVFGEIEQKFPEVIMRIKAGMTKKEWLKFSGEKQ